VCAVVLVVAACSKTSTDTQTGAPSTPTGTAALDTTSSSAVAAGPTIPIAPTPADQPGEQHLHFKYGPIKIQPGQNNITTNDLPVPQPEVDGYIVGIRPNLQRMDGSIPPVDVIHLHHGVWLSFSSDPNERRYAEQSGSTAGEQFYAAGEEKTALQIPAGYGLPYHAKDHWVLNYMLHNLLTTPDQVFITYDIDFIPATAPGAASLTAVHPLWMDVQNHHIYPVFDVLKGSGTNGTFTYPDQATDPYGGGAPLNQWTAPEDVTFVATAGHLHPGGLHVDLADTRAGAGATAAAEAKGSIKGDTAHLFESQANYYEPAGAVSWDVAMTATPADWRVTVRKGDTISISATYDTTRASWYESMGIAVVFYADGAHGTDPFTKAVDVPGLLTHGHLPENDHHGGGTDPKFADLTTLPSSPASTVEIADFTYAPGDMATGISTSVPTVQPGGTLTFDNKDAPVGVGIWHTITACKAPCNGETGVAYPLADGTVIFDSGELGDAGPPTAGRVDWTIPTNLPSGTYTYFCRIHPSMRGAFRVAASGTDTATAGSTAP
jgi:plastocyanin